MYSLITLRHNDIRDGVANLAGKDFTPKHVHGDPKMFTGHAVRGGKAKAKGNGSLPKDEGELREGLLIQYIWMQGTDSIHDMCVMNTDVVSHQSKNTEKCMETAER